MTWRRALGWLLLAVQALLAVRVMARLAATARGERIPVAPAGGPVGAVSVIVPTLNEAERLGPCLNGLTRQGPEVAEILVVDGGSNDGTVALARRFAEQDPRVRVVENGTAPAGTNGKVHNLEAGRRAADPASRWVLTIDADVRPEPGLAAALTAFADRRDLRALSVATRQRLSGPAEGLLHPSMLATLVTRYGIPGHAVIDVRRVQANGQCMLLDRDVLAEAGGFAPLASEICEDVTLARTIAALGHPVGFHEADGLVAVEMYRGWRDAWDGWSRSLPMRDRHWGDWGWLGLLEVALVQAAPLPLTLLLLGRARGLPATALLKMNLGLLAARVGLLAGTLRAYEAPPPTVWLSPVCDLPVAGRIWLSALRRRQTWRGATLLRGGRE